MRFRTVLAALILWTPLCASTHARTVNEAIVYIKCTAEGLPESRGTGVLASEDGHVLTARHVVPDGYSKGARNSTFILRRLIPTRERLSY
jgi:hypothetical protein